MSPAAITAARVGTVVVYAFIGSLLAGGGFTASEFGLMVVLGVICLVAVVVADWVNEGVRRDDDLR